MPFVQRNWKGEITGVYALPQPGYAEEELPNEDPELAAFNAAYPIPNEILRPLTPTDIKRIENDAKRLEKEHADLRNAIWAFNSAFSELELSLSAMLYAALNISHSQVAYAIYFSPSGFDARKEIVNNVVQQLILENPRLADLSPLWTTLFERFRRVQKTRNDIAHGMPITLSIRGQKHARLTSPAFDQNRVGRHIAKTGQPAGRTANDIMEGARKARWLSERIDDVNRLLATFHEDGNPELPDKFALLEAGLLTNDSR